MKNAPITFMLIGLIASFVLLYANERGIIIDDVVTDMTNTTAWELAFGTYMLFFIGGLCTEMLIVKRGYFSITEDFFKLIMVNIIFILSMFFLSAVASGVTGNLNIYMINIRNEFYNWSIPLGLIYVLYIINLFVRRK